MGEEKKTTFMGIKVDLQCPRCRKKIKKLLCKIPQVQDQQYKEKENLVVIKVVCCSPEKIKQKIICKGGDTIKSIEIIKETEKKPQPPPKEENPPEKTAEKKENPKQTAEPKENPPPKEDAEPVSKPPVEPVCVPVGFGTCCTECSEGRGGGPCLYGLGTRPPPTPKPVPLPVGFGTCCTECSEGRGGGPCFYGLGRPPITPVPVPVPVPANPVGFGTCCTECYEGRDGGPCHYGHASYGGYYYGRPIYDSYGGGYRSCYTYVSRCEETSPGCIIM
ncbi:hypothetical protein ACB092_05G212400 [Castanea dentata]